MKPLRLLALPLLLVLSQAASAQALREVAIAVGATGFGTAPARLAKEMGLFEKAGLNARLITMDSGAAATTALISGAVEAAVSGSAELVSAQARGQKIIIVTSFYSGSAGTLVLSKAATQKLGVAANAPVEQRIKALAGLTLATPSATSGYTVSLRAMSKITGAEMRFAYMAPAAMASALETGAVQGIIAGAPSWAPPVVKGTGEIWISGPKQEFPEGSRPISNGSMQTLRSVADRDPALMDKLARTFDMLSAAIRERPAEVKAALGRVYSDLSPDMLTLLFDLESPAWQARQLTPADMKQEIAFVRSSGIDLPQIDSVDPASMLYLK